MQFNVAQRITQRMELLKEDAQTATERVLEDMTRRLTFTAGAITIDASGKTGIYWTSEKMAWAYQKADKIHSGIRRGQDFVEDVWSMDARTGSSTDQFFLKRAKHTYISLHIE